MFALLALICFVLALFKVHVGDVSLLILGFCFLALHHLVPLTFGTLVRREP